MIGGFEDMAPLSRSELDDNQQAVKRDAIKVHNKHGRRFTCVRVKFHIRNTHTQ